MKLVIIKVKNLDDLNLCSSVRKQVFFDEENGPESLSIIDDKDKDKNTLNILGFINNIPVATARFIKINYTTSKIQRMSVLSKYRNKGYAKELLFFLEDCIKKCGYKIIELDSSFKAVGFYEKYGYKRISDVFYEDNRPHIKLKKIIH